MIASCSSNKKKNKSSLYIFLPIKDSIEKCRFWSDIQSIMPETTIFETRRVFLPFHLSISFKVISVSVLFLKFYEVCFGHLAILHIKSPSSHYTEPKPFQSVLFYEHWIPWKVYQCLCVSAMGDSLTGGISLYICVYKYRLYIGYI